MQQGYVARALTIVHRGRLDAICLDVGRIFTQTRTLSIALRRHRKSSLSTSTKRTLYTSPFLYKDDSLQKSKHSEQQKEQAVETSKSVSASPSPQKFFDTPSEQPDYDISQHKDLPKDFGTNQFMQIDEEMRDRLRQLLWQFRAPIRYAIAYGSGVFSQGKASSDSKPMVDLLFGVTYTQHWHSLNLTQHRDHYSGLGYMGSAVISYVQDNVGAGVYFNPYVEMNGMMIKYGVVNLDTLCEDLADWDTLYLAGRHHKPVKILRDDSRVRLSNQMNLLSALRVALLLLPEEFTEHQLYTTIAGISYLGDPRMSLFAENPHKVANIVENQLQNFRRLYFPLIDTLPNIAQKSSSLSLWVPKDTMLIQDMDPLRRGNMVRRLPKHFRDKLYFQYQRKWRIPSLEFRKLMESTSKDEATSGKKGGEFEQRIAKDLGGISEHVSKAIKVTIGWPSTTQSMKGLLTSGLFKSWKYTLEKMKKFRSAKKN